MSDSPLHLADEHAFLAVHVSDGAAQKNDALVGQLVHEPRVLIPPGLVPPSTPGVPRRAAHMLDEEVIGHNAV